MVYRATFNAVFEELASAFNASDTGRAARCFAFPTLIRSSGAIEVFDGDAALATHFDAHLSSHRDQGIIGYAFELGDVFASGPVGLAEVVWRHTGDDDAPGAKTRIWYHMVETTTGWRIESVRNED